MNELAFVSVLESVTHVRLKCAEEVTQKRMLDPERQHFPLNHGALDIIVLQHGVLAQSLYRVVVLTVPQFHQ